MLLLIVGLERQIQASSTAVLARPSSAKASRATRLNIMGGHLARSLALTNAHGKWPPSHMTRLLAPITKLRVVDE
jgi:hypothetical protein